MNALTLATLIGLLAATGLRPGEAAALEQSDADLEAQLLTIRESKFGKSRLVPIHPSTVAALRHYARERERVFPHPHSSLFFVSERGTALDMGAVRLWLCKISVACGLRQKAEGHRCGRGPRLQDLPLLITQSSLTATGVLEILLAKLGQRPSFKRSANLLVLEKHLADIDPLTNAPYYGTHRGKKNLQWKDEPDFRPLPDHTD